MPPQQREKARRSGAGSAPASSEEVLQLEMGLGQRGLSTPGQPVPSWGATEGDAERGGGCRGRDWPD